MDPVGILLKSPPCCRLQHFLRNSINGCENTVISARR